MYRTFELQ